MTDAILARARRDTIENQLKSLGYRSERTEDPAAFARAMTELGPDSGSLTAATTAVPPLFFHGLLVRDHQERVAHCQAFRIDGIPEGTMHGFVERFFDSFARRDAAFMVPKELRGVSGTVAYKGEFKIGNGLKGRRLAMELGILGTCDLLLNVPDVDFAWAVFDPPAMVLGAPAWAGITRVAPVGTAWEGWLVPESHIGAADRDEIGLHIAARSS